MRSERGRPRPFCGTSLELLESKSPIYFPGVVNGPSWPGPRRGSQIGSSCPLSPEPLLGRPAGEAPGALAVGRGWKARGLSGGPEGQQARLGRRATMPSGGLALCTEDLGTPASCLSAFLSCDFPCPPHPHQGCSCLSGPEPWALGCQNMLLASHIRVVSAFPGLVSTLAQPS